MMYLSRFSTRIVVIPTLLCLGGCATSPAIMTTKERIETSNLALLVADVFDMHILNPEILTPEPLSNSMLKTDWDIDGYLVGDPVAIVTFLGDIKILEVGGKPAMFGVLAHPKNQGNSNSYVIAIRGTSDAIEWKVNTFSIDKLKFPAENSGAVSKGFYSIYTSFGYVAVGGQNVSKPAWKQIKSKVGDNNITVVGHSLGAALASYLSADLAINGMNPQLRTRLFASPRPGNGDFSKFFTNTVSDYVVYNNIRDVVPQFPPSFFGFSHQQLENTKWIFPEQYFIDLTNNLGCNHHSVSYAAILAGNTRSLEFWKDRMAKNGNSPKCVREILGTETPISWPVSSKKYIPLAAQAANFHFQFQATKSRPFFHKLAANESRQTPIRIKRLTRDGIIALAA